MNFLFSSVLPSSGSSNSFNVVVSSCLRVWVIFVLQTQHDVCLRKKELQRSKVLAQLLLLPHHNCLILISSFKQGKKTFLVCISCLGT